MRRQHLLLPTLLVVVGTPRTAAAQSAPDTATGRPLAFFARIEPVQFTLTADIKLLRADTADEAPSRNATVSFKDPAGNTVTIPVTVKTHGRWRLTHCEFPPLSITFPAAQRSGTPFEGLPRRA